MKLRGMYVDMDATDDLRPDDVTEADAQEQAARARAGRGVCCDL